MPQSYLEVYHAGDPREPLPEDFPPTICRGERDKEALIIPHDDDDVPGVGRIFLMKSDNPVQAYQLVGKPPEILGNLSRPPGWGTIEFAVIFPRLNHPQASLSFQAPDEDKAQHVAIKKLTKRVVRWYLDQGGSENPYKEISRMQEIGDGIHVLNCIEALEDDDYLYIITPYSHDGCLLRLIQSKWGDGLPEARVQALFRNILEILLYLEQKGIFHHDLSPDNFLFFNGRLLLFDFAMSLKFPRDNKTRYLIQPHTSRFGTPATMAPEVWMMNETTRVGLPHDAVTCDLWSAATILYLMLTGYNLYRYPDVRFDVLFRYYVWSGGLDVGMNETMLDVLTETYVEDGEGVVMKKDPDDLFEREMTHMNISPDARDLLVQVLKFKPEERWSLAQVWQSPWVQANLE